MKEYFNSNYLIGINKIDKEKIVNLDLFYEVEYVTGLNCFVGERYLYNKITSVVYYDIEFSKSLYQYHIEKYGNHVDIQVYLNLSSDSKNIKIYTDGILDEIFTYKYHNERLDIVIWQDSFYNIIEYRQSVYDEEGNHIKEKIFYADSWTIHTEKMI